MLLPERRVGREVQDGLGDVLREDVHAERRALAVVLLELVGLDAVGGGALLAPGRAPDPRALQDRVGVDGVDADAGARRPPRPGSARGAARPPSPTSTRRRSCPRRARSWRRRRRSSRRVSWRAARGTPRARRGSSRCRGSTWLRSHSASVVSSIGALDATPALETTMSTPPKASHRRGERRGHRLLGRDVAADRDPAVAERRDGVGGAVAVEVERDDAGARVGERVDDRAADAAGRAGDERDLALQLAGRRRQRRACRAPAASTRSRSSRRRQRDEAAEGVRAGHDLDRAVVEVARRARRPWSRCRRRPARRPG